ncbi:MAG: hypothetical protein WA317_20430 [Mycobacterium sp.]|uniref:hypothetical protein n=1 Tax=Mycobacterium sp. TaxID=1785 RepID=UPI003CC55B24
MSAPGHRLFADELASFAVEAAEPRLMAIAQRIVAPLRVAVHGRRGVGSSTVAHALAAAGLAVTAPTVTPEAVVQVIAEVVKPEDRVAVAAASQPVLVVLNKADLAGRRCRELGELIGAPTAPMVALLAVAVFDDVLWSALRLLTDQPADLRSPDAFLADAHPVSTATRRRLLETLDLYGIALVVAALQRGASEAAIAALLRRASGVDALLDQLDTLSRGPRYRRVLDAAAELEILAVTDDRISDFLRSDETVIGRMAAAVDAVEATGLKVDPRDDAAAHLRRAVHWQRYARGLASVLLRSCGADIARGSLRLWTRAGDDAERSDEEERR